MGNSSFDGPWPLLLPWPWAKTAGAAATIAAAPRLSNHFFINESPLHSAYGRRWIPAADPEPRMNFLRMAFRRGTPAGENVKQDDPIPTLGWKRFGVNRNSVLGVL